MIDGKILFIKNMPRVDSADFLLAVNPVLAIALLHQDDFDIYQGKGKGDRYGDGDVEILTLTAEDRDEQFPAASHAATEYE